MTETQEPTGKPCVSFKPGNLGRRDHRFEAKGRVTSILRALPEGHDCDQSPVTSFQRINQHIVRTNNDAHCGDVLFVSNGALCPYMLDKFSSRFVLVSEM